MVGRSPDDRDRRADEAELRDLSFAYAAAVDDRDGPRLAGLFLVDGVLVVPRFPEVMEPVVTRQGAEALRAVPEGLRRFERTLHEVTATWSTVDGDRATGDVRCTAHHLSRTDGAARAAGGRRREAIDSVWFIRYGDEYVRTSRGWRIARRVLHLQWVEEHDVVRVGPPR